ALAADDPVAGNERAVLGKPEDRLAGAADQDRAGARGEGGVCTGCLGAVARDELVAAAAVKRDRRQREHTPAGTALVGPAPECRLLAARHRVDEDRRAISLDEHAADFLRPVGRAA